MNENIQSNKQEEDEDKEETKKDEEEVTKQGENLEDAPTSVVGDKPSVDTQNDANNQDKETEKSVVEQDNVKSNDVSTAPSPEPRDAARQTEAETEMKQPDTQINGQRAQNVHQNALLSAQGRYSCPTQPCCSCPQPLSKAAQRQWKITSDEIDKWLRLFVPDRDVDWTIVLHRKE